MYNFAQGNVIDVAVNEARSRRSSQSLAIKMLDGFVVTAPTLAQIEVGSEAARVREQIFDGDRIASFALQLGYEVDQGISETHLALLDEHHDAGRGGDYFREAGQIENRIDRHGFTLGLDGARAIRLAPDDLSVMADQDDRSG